MAKSTGLAIARRNLNRVAAQARKDQRREKLILAHEHVVIKIADQVHRKLTHVDVEDLRQAGWAGLCEAADRYKPGSGVFEHFAYFRVRGAMFDAHKRRAYRDETQQSLEERQSVSEYRDLPKVVAVDRGLLPEAMAAKREQARLLAEALLYLDEDEQRVFIGALRNVPLIQTARECGRSIAWARAKLASARCQLGARVQMWGLGLDKAA